MTRRRALRILTLAILALGIWYLSWLIDARATSPPPHFVPSERIVA